MTDSSDMAALSAQIANLAMKLSRCTAFDADTALMMAEDELSTRGQDKAAMLTDGFRAGVQQAIEAAAGSRVLVVWYDDNSARVTFSWDSNVDASEDYASSLRAAVESALRMNGSYETD